MRFLAAASDAFLARAERSSGVMFRAAVLPPSLPYAFPSDLRYSSTSCGIRLLMSLIVHLSRVWCEPWKRKIYPEKLLHLIGVRCILSMVLVFD